MTKSSGAPGASSPSDRHVLCRGAGCRGLAGEGRESRLDTGLRSGWGPRDRGRAWPVHPPRGSSHRPHESHHRLDSDILRSRDHCVHGCGGAVLGVEPRPDILVGPEGELVVHFDRRVQRPRVHHLRCVRPHIRCVLGVGHGLGKGRDGWSGGVAAGGDRAGGAGAGQGHLARDGRARRRGQAAGADRRRGRRAGTTTTGAAAGRSTCPTPSWWPSGRSGTSPATAR